MAVDTKCSNCKLHDGLERSILTNKESTASVCDEIKDKVWPEVRNKVGLRLFLTILSVIVMVLFAMGASQKIVSNNISKVEKNTAVIQTDIKYMSKTLQRIERNTNNNRESRVP